MIVATPTGYQVRDKNGRRLSLPILTLEQAKTREKILIKMVKVWGDKTKVAL